MADAAVTAPAAPTPEATPAPVDPNAPKAGEKVYEIKYPDGRVEKRGESWIQDRAQKSIGLEQRVTAADKYEKAFNNFVAKVQDPSQLVELLNHPDLKYDEDKQAALITSALGSKKPKVIEAVKRWLYENEVEPELLKKDDPKEYERREWQRKAEALENEKSKREKETKDAEDAKNVEDIKQAYRVKLGESFTKSGLPTNDYLVRQVMEKARLYVKAGKHPDFDNCCKLVQSEFVEQVKSVLGSAKVENILSLMDGETPKKVNEALMKAVDRKDAPLKLDGERPKKREKPKTSTEKKQWLRNLERGIID